MWAFMSTLSCAGYQIRTSVQVYRVLFLLRNLHFKVHKALRAATKSVHIPGLESAGYAIKAFLQG